MFYAKIAQIFLICFHVSKKMCKFERYKAMANNMTIGPALIVGGNKVEMTTNGKVQVTNQEGKIKTLSQDQFKKQLVKNADKISNGENVEFKKDNKAGLIAGGAVATAAVVTGIIFRKDIAKYMKDFSFKKLGQDIKGLFGKLKGNLKKLNPFKKDKPTPPNVFDGRISTPRNKAEMQTARETLKLKQQTEAADLHARVADFLESKARTRGKARKEIERELIDAFKNSSTPQKRADVLAEMAVNNAK